MKKTLAVVLSLALVGGTFSAFAGCSKDDETAGSGPYLKESGSEIQIGIENEHYWQFTKGDDSWNFDGVYVYADGKATKAFEGEDGKMFRYKELQYNQENPGTQLNNTIDTVEVKTNEEDEKAIVLKNEDAEMTISVDGTDSFVHRDFKITIDKENQLAAYQAGFALRSVSNLFMGEYGAIATKDPVETQAQVPYAFPAFYSQIYNESLNVNVVNVVDYVETSPAFQNMRRRKAVDVYELGVFSSEIDIAANTVLEYHDSFSINTQEKDFYDLIAMAADQFFSMSPLNVEAISEDGNRSASSWTDIAAGLYDNLTDSRTGTDSFLGVMTPYGYLEEQNGGWGEMFALLNTLKGMTRYSRYTEDEAIIETVDQMASVIVTPQGDKSWISKYTGENAKDDEYFLNHTYSGGAFGQNSSGEETGTVPGISTWKYYDMIANLGEIAILTDSDALKEGFLKLMPFFNSLQMEGYVQPVAWYYSNREPASGYENGGSGGAASMWAYVHFLASELTTDSALKEKYREDAIGSLKHANTLDYFNMYAMRVAVKPVAIGWNVKTNILAYELTGEKEYLEHAQKVVKSVLSFYYLNSNPFTYFASYGFAYADLRERWEAYFEMATALWLVIDVMEYMPTDTSMLDVYFSASRTHQWAYPINGEPYGSYDRAGAYDSLDGYYIPFEFTTGVLGDNPGGEGGSQANLRQIKEIYGSGETFLEYLMYEAWGYSTDKSVLTLCLTGTKNYYSNENHKFILYNPNTTEKSAPFVFNNFAEGTYAITFNGQKVGELTSAQLANGVSITLPARGSITVSIDKV